jgi:endoglucanase
MASTGLQPTRRSRTVARAGHHRIVGFSLFTLLLCCGGCESGGVASASDSTAEVAATSVIQAAAPASREPTSSEERGHLRVVDLGLVAPDVIAVSIRAGTIVHGEYVPYDEAPGDRVERDRHHRSVFRDGAYLGALVGREQALVRTPDHLVGERLPTEVDSRELYAISSAEDPSYASRVQPSKIGRKTKPVDIAIWPGRGWESATESVVYLSLPRNLAEGKSYRVEFGFGELAPVDFTYDVSRLRSDAVHVSHVGFHPGDPVKVAFLSTWMGSGGPLDYGEGLDFWVVDTQTGEVAFEGRTTLAKSMNEAEDASGRNFNGTNVYTMEFDELDQEGEFVVVVEGVGRSYPFQIDREVWRRAFYVSARGLYHQRSGIELGEPYTTYRRPRAFHPDDGIRVYQSSCPLMDSGNGLSYRARKRDNFECLVNGKLDQTLPQAWGGYMDAGDWDRRIQHLRSSRFLIELAEMFPEYFAGLALDIPESGTALPDVVSEALFNLDFYRRMQADDGGVRGGVESAGHPRQGEASWLESLDVMAYAPGIWSSHWYAGMAARAAHLLRARDPERAGGYERSALAAMEYAEGRWADLGEPKIEADGVVDARNLAAVELYRLTGDQRWHDVFLATTVFADQGARLSRWPEFNQADAAWVYVRTAQPGVDRRIQENCRQAILQEADSRVAQTGETGFRWTKNPWSSAAWGAFAVPDGISLARAHYLTGDEKYLRALILATQHGAGANPLNMSYTTGIGAKFPDYPLHIDSRMSHQPPPPGLTVFGPLGFKEGKGQWGQSLADPFLFPPFESWPTTEAYWDIHAYGPMNEYTVHNSIAPNAYVWGYLAAAPRS